MTDQQMKASRPRRTRYDHTRRNVLTIVLVTLGLLIIGAIAALGAFGGSRSVGEPRALDISPRSIDIWAVYPDDSVRMVTVFNPIENPLEVLLDVVSPLVSEAEAIESVDAIGGEIVETEVLPGPGHDSGLYYEKYNISREAGTEPYGIDVLTRSSPYVTPSAGDPALREFSIGTAVQSFYEQAIVAVAFPKETTFESAAGSSYVLLAPYRETTIGGWRVYYFDVTAVNELDTILFVYQPADSSPGTLNYRQVIQRR